MRRPETAAVRVRVAVYRLALKRGADTALLAQLRDELAAEMRVSLRRATPARVALVVRQARRARA